MDEVPEMYFWLVIFLVTLLRLVLCDHRIIKVAKGLQDHQVQPDVVQGSILHRKLL